MQTHTRFETKEDVRTKLEMLEQCRRYDGGPIVGRIAALLNDPEAYERCHEINSSQRFHLGKARVAGDTDCIRALMQRAIHEQDWETALHACLMSGRQWHLLSLAALACADGNREIAFIAYLAGQRTDDAARVFPESALHRDVCAQVARGPEGLRALGTMFDCVWMNGEGFAPAAFIPLLGAYVAAPST